MTIVTLKNGSKMKIMIIQKKINPTQFIESNQIRIQINRKSARTQKTAGSKFMYLKMRTTSKEIKIVRFLTQKRVVSNNNSHSSNYTIMRQPQLEIILSSKKNKKEKAQIKN